jgi:hypothetical protein
MRAEIANKSQQTAYNNVKIENNQQAQFYIDIDIKSNISLSHD